MFKPSDEASRFARPERRKRSRRVRLQRRKRRLSKITSGRDRSEKKPRLRIVLAGHSNAAARCPNPGRNESRTSAAMMTDRRSARRDGRMSEADRLRGKVDQETRSRIKSVTGHFRREMISVEIDLIVAHISEAVRRCVRVT